ncbi:MscS family membrane protein [Roseibium hamelinense]|uniref:MscS family membrane protein n=1 Tax=Roseibium hamelinense TaxID=150831 RepID=A0A562T7B9_9HYPH|nr:mechanosensitive ion channel family protein [Roseibium hamelinense]MTI42833.1 mechanosensitive ion channel [Roseibium hamelinense]TWI89499.1 MscS family membrane protein [Roseibium hamelinense]
MPENGKSNSQRVLHLATLATRAWVIVSVLLVLASTIQVLAQPLQTSQPPSPLQPAQNASPRDSLQSFLRNTDALIALWRVKAPIREQKLYLRAAVESFNFEDTPYASSTSEQIERLLLAREILARTVLPPFDTIPNQADVAATGLTSWTVPGTDLRMTRIEAGRDAGDFKFDPITIEELELDYRRSRELPRLDGAQDAYQEYSLKPDIHGITEDLIANRLRGVRTTSPRDTLEAFMFNMNAAYAIATRAEAALDAVPPAISLQKARELQMDADDHLLQATSVFDLSEIPDVLRRDTGTESALLLKEILDRMPLPRLDAIPDAADLSGLAPEQAYRWRLPGTRIEIERLQSGPNAGNFLFDSASVEILLESYDALKDLPYRTDSTLTLADFRSSNATPGFYEFYISTPGYLVPSTHVLGEIVERLPGFLSVLVSGQTLWQWLGLVLTLIVLAAACWVVFKIVDGAALRFPGLITSWVAITAPLLAAYFVHLATGFVDNDINFTGIELSYLLFGAGVLELAFYVWAVWRLFNAVGTTILASPTMSGRGFDTSLIRLLSGILAVIASVGVAVFGLERLGVDIVPLLAGLGVGGLAVALAIRPTLENLISGLILFTDKPVRVGDFCTFGDTSGTVEDVGIRSTQIRGLDRALVSVPNAKFVDMELINWARCDKMLIKTTIGLRYETSDDQLRFVLVRLREMLHAHPKIDNETIRVRFSNYGDSSLDIAVRVYALTNDWNEFHAIREDVFLRIKAIIEASGTGFAFPSQTLYMAQDDGLNEDLSARADEEVAAWRRSGTLPFPRLTPDRMKALDGTLDYPPEGSSESAQARARDTQAAEPLSDPEWAPKKEPA